MSVTTLLTIMIPIAIASIDNIYIKLILLAIELKITVDYFRNL